MLRYCWKGEEAGVLFYKVIILKKNSKDKMHNPVNNKIYESTSITPSGCFHLELEILVVNQHLTYHSGTFFIAQDGDAFGFTMSNAFARSRFYGAWTPETHIPIDFLYIKVKQNSNYNTGILRSEFTQPGVVVCILKDL